MNWSQTKDTGVSRVGNTKDIAVGSDEAVSYYVYGIWKKSPETVSFPFSAFMV